MNVFRMFGKLGGGKPGAEWVATESSGALPLEQVVKESIAGAPDVNVVATRNGDEVDVLLWNYHDADVEVASAAVHLGVDGLRGKTAVASEFRMDWTHSNAYRVWQQMGSPAHP